MTEEDQNPIQNRSMLRFFNMKLRVKKNVTASGNESEGDNKQRSKKRIFGIFKLRQKSPVSKANEEEEESNSKGRDNKEVANESSIKLVVTSPERKSYDISSTSLKSETSTSQISRKESWLNSFNPTNNEKKIQHRIGEPFANIELVYVRESGIKVPVVLKGLVNERKDAFERKIKELDASQRTKLESTCQTRKHLRPKVLNFEPKFDPITDQSSNYRFKPLGLSSWHPIEDKRFRRKDEYVSSIFGEEEAKRPHMEKFEGQDKNNPARKNITSQTDERRSANSTPDQNMVKKPLIFSKDLPTIPPETAPFLDESNKTIPSMCFLQDRETIIKYLQKLREVLKEEQPDSSTEWTENNLTATHSIGTNYQDEINGLLKSVFLIRKQVQTVYSSELNFTILNPKENASHKVRSFLRVQHLQVLYLDPKKIHPKCIIK